MKRKGFTLVELLVVIAIIALLMGILMPALSRVRQIAFRVVCGTNLSGIGKAMLIYSNDYDDELPRSGGRNSPWAAKIPNWQAANRFGAYGVSALRLNGEQIDNPCLKSFYKHLLKSCQNLLYQKQLFLYYYSLCLLYLCDYYFV